MDKSIQQSRNLKKVGRTQTIDIDRNDVLGGDISCKVFGGRFDDKEVAVKRMDPTSHKCDIEIETLTQLDHVNVVKYRYKDQDDEFFYLVMERCLCSLYDYISNNEKWKNVVPSCGDTVQLEVKDIFGQMALGLNYLHGKRIIHRGIHPYNILFSFCDGKMVVRISDFVLTKRINPGSTSASISGTRGVLNYSSPENLRKEKMSEKSDVFSLGIVFYAVLTNGLNPFGQNDIDIQVKIKDQQEPSLDLINEYFNGYAFHLLLSMLSNPKEVRPTMGEVLAHYFFWSDKETLRFLEAASDDLKDHQQVSPVEEMMKHSREIIGWTDWTYTICSNLSTEETEILFKDLPKREQERGHVIGLLRTIRNWTHHYGTKPEELKNIVGKTKTEMLKFFISKFPNLLPVTWNVFKVRKNYEDFGTFYV